jgi:hypothetical protein
MRSESDPKRLLVFVFLVVTVCNYELVVATGRRNIMVADGVTKLKR